MATMVLVPTVRHHCERGAGSGSGSAAIAHGMPVSSSSSSATAYRSDVPPAPVHRVSGCNACRLHHAHRHGGEQPAGSPKRGGLLRLVGGGGEACSMHVKLNFATPNRHNTADRAVVRESESRASKTVVDCERFRSKTDFAQTS
jgi:hypothetical protein